MFKNIVAQATRRWDGRYALRFPYSRAMVDSLKEYIPASYREYEPESKTWIIDQVYAYEAIDILRSIFPDAKVGDDEDTFSPPTSPPQQAGPYAVLYITPDAPKCVVDAAYRALSREIHPDRAPIDQRDLAHEQMVALNQAYSILRDRVPS